MMSHNAGPQREVVVVPHATPIGGLSLLSLLVASIHIYIYIYIYIHTHIHIVIHIVIYI